MRLIHVASLLWAYRVFKLCLDYVLQQWICSFLFHKTMLNNLNQLLSRFDRITTPPINLYFELSRQSNYSQIFARTSSYVNRFWLFEHIWQWFLMTLISKLSDFTNHRPDDSMFQLARCLSMIGLGCSIIQDCYSRSLLDYYK